MFHPHSHFTGSSSLIGTFFDAFSKFQTRTDSVDDVHNMPQTVHTTDIAAGLSESDLYSATKQFLGSGQNASSHDIAAIPLASVASYDDVSTHEAPCI